MSNQASIPVIVNGAAGKMGREVIKAVAQAPDLTLLGAIDTSPQHQGQDAGEVAGLSEPLEVPISNQLEPILAYVAGERQMQPGVLVDFTHPDVVYNNIRSAIAYGIRPVVGTTGLSPAQIQELSDFAEKASSGCLIIPNFSIGMVLLQEAAVRASQYFDHVEIIELHHNQKADAPSGTAIQTAQLLAEMGKTFNTAMVEETEKIPGAR
ncbi:MAG: 4-hydroxy-tetrahydrodipicolinate reductase, partial [Dolichospermum sp.]